MARGRDGNAARPLKLSPPPPDEKCDGAAVRAHPAVCAPAAIPGRTGRRRRSTLKRNSTTSPSSSARPEPRREAPRDRDVVQRSCRRVDDEVVRVVIGSIEGEPVEVEEN